MNKPDFEQNLEQILNFYPFSHPLKCPSKSYKENMGIYITIIKYKVLAVLAWKAGKTSQKTP